MTKNDLKDPKIREILKALNCHKDERGNPCDCHIEAVFTEADLCPEGERLKKEYVDIIKGDIPAEK